MTRAWGQAEETEQDVTSMHMEIVLYFENTQYGSGQIESRILDINGDDIHEQDLIFGQVYAEYIRVDGRQYSKDLMNDEWVEVEETPVEDSANEFTSPFWELPDQADEQEFVGTEVIDDSEAMHYRFILSPQSIIEMYTAYEPSDYSDNTGGVVDVWIDKENYYLLKYELVIYNAKISDEIGYGDIKSVVNVRNTNEPIEITAPI
jgi:hypothetical protein